MKKILLHFLFAAVQTQLFAQLEVGQVFPDFSLVDTEEVTWNLYEVLNSGKDVQLIVGQAEDAEFWNNLISGDYNYYYDIYGPNGSNECMFFLIDANPNNLPEALDGVNAAGDYNSDLNFSVVDADNALLELLEYDPLNFPSTKISICHQGYLHSIGPVWASDVSETINICDDLFEGFDVEAIIIPGNYDCYSSAEYYAMNKGTEAINEFDYSISVDGVTNSYSWSGNLLPFGSAYLNNTPSGGINEQFVELNLALEDEVIENDYSSEEIFGLPVCSSHLRLVIQSEIDEECWYYIYYNGTGGWVDWFEGGIDISSNTILDIHFPEIGCYELNLNGGCMIEGANSYLASVGIDGSETILYDNTMDPYIFELFTGSFVVDQIVPFNLTGTVFHDQNEDGLKDSFEQGIGGIEVHLGSQVTYTSASGQYTFPDVNIDDYTEVSIVYDDVLWPTSTTGATVPIDNGMMSNFNFGLSTNEPVYMLSANSWEPWFFCGFDGTLYISVANDGNTATSGTLTAILDPLLTYTGATPTPISFDGITAVWDISSLPIGGPAYFYIDVVAPTFEQMGETLTTTLNIITYDGDGIEVANTTTENSGIVNCSYDPNDITGFPAGTTDAHYIMNGTELEYLVRFQNTGNYQAFDIRVDDQLDADLDFTTFEFIGSSHSCVPVFNTETGLIQFYFDDINLPDSTTNESGSHGWLRYRISPQSPLAEMTTIENTAYIYFDFNPAVITNTYVHTISDLYFGLDELVQTPLLLYPNPANGSVTIQTSNAIRPTTICISDINGKMVMQQKTNGLAVVNTSALNAGIYIVEAQGRSAVQRARLVIQR